MQCFLSEKDEDEKITVDEKPSIKEAPVVEEGTDYTDDDDGNPISILCHLPKDQEACTYSPAWFYDPAKGDCTRLIYGKCPGDNKNQFNSERKCRHACGWTPGSHVPKEEKGNDYWFAKTVKYWDDFNPKSKFKSPRPSVKSKPKPNHTDDDDDDWSREKEFQQFVKREESGDLTWG